MCFITSLPTALQRYCNSTDVDRSANDVTMFCEFTPQYVASGWSEMGLTSGVAQVTKGKGMGLDH